MYLEGTVKGVVECSCVLSVGSGQKSSEWDLKYLLDAHVREANGRLQIFHDRSGSELQPTDFYRRRVLNRDALDLTLASSVHTLGGIIRIANWKVSGNTETFLKA